MIAPRVTPAAVGARLDWGAPGTTCVPVTAQASKGNPNPGAVDGNAEENRHGVGTLAFMAASFI